MEGSLLATLIERGGIYFNVAGATPEEVLAAAVKIARFPEGFEKDAVLYALLEREKLTSTAIGNGFAIPHPRALLARDGNSACMVICYLENGVDWRGPDGLKVETLFLIFSSDEKVHLNTLAVLGEFCKRDDFVKLIATQPSKDELIAFVEKG